VARALATESRPNFPIFSTDSLSFNAPRWPARTQRSSPYKRFRLHTPSRLQVLSSSRFRLFVWLVAISVLPYREERFLYVVYPMCVSRLLACPSCAVRGGPHFRRRDGVVLPNSDHVSEHSAHDAAKPLTRSGCNKR
jgi:hypothetical protein